MTYDIVIVGGGMVGSALACALAQQTSLSIVVLEAQAETSSWSKSNYHHRVSAIALSSQRIFQALNMWEDIKQKRVSPFTQIQVWDHNGKGDIEFNCEDIAESVLGFIIENNVIQTALEDKLKQYPHVTFVSPIRLTELREHADSIELIASDERTFKAKLVIAADGAQSWVRKAAGIEMETHDYKQRAIVASVTTDLPHQQIARQCFLENGPLAFLPLADTNISSIVWSLPVTEAKRLVELNADEFGKELGNAFSNRLGAVLDVGQRYIFPLHKQQAKQYVKSRVILIGDAAHTVHPLAGQGVNMGLLDAASLSEIIADAIGQRRDFASKATLRRYERWRKADNLTMLASVDMIKSLFASNKTSIHTLRSFGLMITNKMHVIKNIFTRHAVGDRAGLPKLAQLRSEH